MLSNFESPPTHKQKQLQEFSLNLKQNKINKYGKSNDSSTAAPILNKSLRRKMDKVDSFKVSVRVRLILYY